jgi:hypothetical protein
VSKWGEDLGSDVKHPRKTRVKLGGSYGRIICTEDFLWGRALAKFNCIRKKGKNGQFLLVICLFVFVCV